MDTNRVLVIWKSNPAGFNHCVQVIHIPGVKLYDELEAEITNHLKVNCSIGPTCSIEHFTDIPGIVQDLVANIITNGEASFKDRYCFSLNEVYKSRISG